MQASVYETDYRGSTPRWETAAHVLNVAQRGGALGLDPTGEAAGSNPVIQNMFAVFYARVGEWHSHPA